MKAFSALVLTCLLASSAHAQMGPGTIFVPGPYQPTPYGWAYTGGYGYGYSPTYYPPVAPAYYGGYGSGVSYGELRVQRELREIRWNLEDANFQRRWAPRRRY